MDHEQGGVHRDEALDVAAEQAHVVDEQMREDEDDHVGDERCVLRDKVLAQFGFGGINWLPEPFGVDKDDAVPRGVGEEHLTARVVPRARLGSLHAQHAQDHRLARLVAAHDEHLARRVHVDGRLQALVTTEHPRHVQLLRQDVHAEKRACFARSTAHVRRLRRCSCWRLRAREQVTQGCEDASRGLRLFRLRLRGLAFLHRLPLTELGLVQRGDNARAPLLLMISVPRGATAAEHSTHTVCSFWFASSSCSPFWIVTAGAAVRSGH